MDFWGGTIAVLFIEGFLINILGGAGATLFSPVC